MIGFSVWFCIHVWVLFARQCPSPGERSLPGLTPPSSPSERPGCSLGAGPNGGEPPRRHKAVKRIKSPRHKKNTQTQMRTKCGDEQNAAPPYLPWNQSLQASHSIINWVTSYGNLQMQYTGGTVAMFNSQLRRMDAGQQRQRQQEPSCNNVQYDSPDPGQSRWTWT